MSLAYESAAAVCRGATNSALGVVERAAERVLVELAQRAAQKLIDDAAKLFDLPLIR